MFSRSIGWKKLGQPVPDSNLVPALNSGSPQQAAASRCLSLASLTAAAERPLRAVLEQYAALLVVEIGDEGVQLLGGLVG